MDTYEYRKGWIHRNTGEGGYTGIQERGRYTGIQERGVYIGSQERGGYIGIQERGGYIEIQERGVFIRIQEGVDKFEKIRVKDGNTGEGDGRDRNAKRG